MCLCRAAYLLRNKGGLSALSHSQSAHWEKLKFFPSQQFPSSRRALDKDQTAVNWVCHYRISSTYSTVTTPRGLPNAELVIEKVSACPLGEICAVSTMLRTLLGIKFIKFIPVLWWNVALNCDIENVTWDIWSSNTIINTFFFHFSLPLTPYPQTDSHEEEQELTL